DALFRASRERHDDADRRHAVGAACAKRDAPSVPARLCPLERGHALLVFDAIDAEGDGFGRVEWLAERFEIRPLGLEDDSELEVPRRGPPGAPCGGAPVR